MLKTIVSQLTGRIAATAVYVASGGSGRLNLSAEAIEYLKSTPLDPGDFGVGEVPPYLMNTNKTGGGSFIAQKTYNHNIYVDSVMLSSVWKLIDPVVTPGGLPLSVAYSDIELTVDPATLASDVTRTWKQPVLGWVIYMNKYDNFKSSPYFTFEQVGDPTTQVKFLYDNGDEQAQIFIPCVDKMYTTVMSAVGPTNTAAVEAYRWIIGDNVTTRFQAYNGRAFIRPVYAATPAGIVGASAVIMANSDIQSKNGGRTGRELQDALLNVSLLAFANG